MITPKVMRNMADTMEKYPTLFNGDQTFFVQYYGLQVFFYNAYDENGNEIPESAAALISEWSRTLRRDGQCADHKAEKKFSDEYLTMIVKMDEYEIHLMATRNSVCRKVETGEMETVTVKDYSNTPMVTKVVPVTKWECSPLLSD